MSTMRSSLVHSLSMFQPSLTHPDQSQPHKPTSINRQSCRRSQSVRRSQFQTCSQSVEVSGAPHGHHLSFSRHASKEGSNHFCQGISEREVSKDENIWMTRIPIPLTLSHIHWMIWWCHEWSLLVECWQEWRTWHAGGMLCWRQSKNRIKR